MSKPKNYRILNASNLDDLPKIIRLLIKQLGTIPVEYDKKYEGTFIGLLDKEEHIVIEDWMGDND